MWSTNLINSGRLIEFLCIFNLINFLQTERVKVKIYDHRAQHDPIEKYGKGPWNYYGYGYGLEYQYEPDGTYERQKGYGFVKAYGRDFCKDADKSKCSKQVFNADHQPIITTATTSNSGEHEINNNHYLDNGVLNSNYLNAPIAIKDAASSNRVLVKDRSSASDDELRNKLNHQKIVHFYQTNKNVPFPDTLESFDTKSSNLPSSSQQSVNGLSSSDIVSNILSNGNQFDEGNSDSVNDTNNVNKLPRSTGEKRPIHHFNYANHINHIDINQSNLDNRLIKQPNDQTNENSIQNSQLIDTSNRATDAQPIHLASNHHTHFDDESGEHSYHDDMYDEKHYDPFAEHLNMPKIVHPAGKQLKRNRHSNHDSYESGDHRSSSNYKDEYDDTFEAHLLGATRLQPKFIKLLTNNANVDRNASNEYSNRTSSNLTALKSPEHESSGEQLVLPNKKNASESFKEFGQTVTVRNRSRREANRPVPFIR